MVEGSGIGDEGEAGSAEHVRRRDSEESCDG